MKTPNPHPVTFFQSAIGMPYAICGNFIAKWKGRVKEQDIFELETVEQFERNHFPVSKLRQVKHGMPRKYVNGLLSALRESYSWSAKLDTL